ncbi:hypothetical protein V3F56_03070 [Moorellaceae bacterium AZ2]
MAWAAAWMAGGILDGLTGCYYGFAGAVLCSLFFPVRRTGQGSSICDVPIFGLVFLLGNMWALSKVYSFPGVLMTGVGVYLGALFLSDRVRVILWGNGMRLPWMGSPLQGVAVEAGLELRRALGRLWKPLVVITSAAVVLWTFNAVVDWWHYMDVLWEQGELRGGIWGK